MSIIKALLILSLTLLPLMALARGTSSNFNSPNMEKECDNTIQLDGDRLPGTYFSLSSSQYRQNLNCTLTIKAATVNQRIIIVVDKMDIACGGDKILIYDGKKDQGSLLNKNESQQCGTQKYHLRTLTSNTVIIQFISNADGKVGNGFVLNVAINFPVATCSAVDHLYRCKNNNCISNLFNCDGRNWCGDNIQSEICR